MILYKKEPYPLQMKNIILLDSGDGGVIYVSKTTYDQALLLSSRFDNDIQRLIQSLKCKTNEGYIVISELKELINNMHLSMPSPINILAAFLIFCAGNQGIEWDRNNYEMGYGILHQFSQLIDFNGMTLVPAEVRANISIPTAILMQYERTWDDLCSTLTDYVVAGLQPVRPQHYDMQLEPTTKKLHEESEVNNKSAQSYAEQNSAEDEEDGGDAIDEDAFAKLQAKLAAIASADSVTPSEEPKKEPEAPKPVETQKPVPVVETKTETASDVLDEFDI